MSFNINDSINTELHVIPQNSGVTSYPAFCRKNNVIEDKLDKVKQQIDEETEKPHNKTAITVGLGVVALSILVALVNPRISSKLIEKLNNLQLKSKSKMKKNKGDILLSRFYKFLANSIEKLTKFISYTNNVNSVKDTYYKQFCTEEKAFVHVRNKNQRNFLKKCDSVVRFLLKRPHETISRWGEGLAKHTVKNRYKNSFAKMDRLETALKKYKDRLTPAEKEKFNELMGNASGQREYFDLKNLENRFINQHNMMQNLNSDIRRQWVNYKKGFTNKYVKTSEHFNKNLSFWAQDIMAKKRETVNKAGKGAVDCLFNAESNAGGSYSELVRLISPHLNKDELTALQKISAKAEKGLRKANKSECMDYFDKKRDLTLGSAPTDILTATVGVTTGAIALASADDKDKRISRTLTGILPAAGGILTSIALTAMLYSGTKGMLAGAATGGILSLIGNDVDKARIKAKNAMKKDN